MKYTTSKVSSYNTSTMKGVVNKLAAVLLLLFTFPLMMLITILVYLGDRKTPIFKQTRVGLNSKPFTIIKFRTMITGAEKLRSKYQNLNMSDGPTFKIPNDPRFTKFGKYLAKSGFDELPQLINILRGEMSLVGPRPLPLIEAKLLTSPQKVRELVLPGITSSWVINGAHRLKFKRWMQLDREYVERATILTELAIIYKTGRIIFSIGIRKLFSLLNP